MLSRHAENLFWTGRYIERAEDTARLLDVTYHTLVEASPFEARRAWRDLLEVLGLEDAFEATGRQPTAREVSEFLVLDTSQPGSIVSSVTHARENVRSLREQVSTELWEAVNSFHLDMRARDLRADLDQPHTLYAMVKRRCQLLAGVAAETMPRDDGWRFLQIGWMLERAEMACRSLAVRLAQASTGTDGYHHWLGILKSASAAEAYRKAHRASIEPPDVIEFLLLSRNFPRSLLFCVRRVEQELGRLGGAADGRLSRPERLLGRLRADLEYADLHEVTGDVDGQELHVFLERMQTGIRQIAEAVALQYFRNSHEVGLTVLDFHPAG